MGGQRLPPSSFTELRNISYVNQLNPEIYNFVLIMWYFYPSYGSD